MRVILAELGGIPHPDSEELKDARDTAITLELTNRFAHVEGCYHFDSLVMIMISKMTLS